ncbi:Jmjd8, partial [Symbiodinium microadriaticum]
VPRPAEAADPTPEELQRLQLLQALERSQMPAVSDDSGLLAKTIEHYTFSDSEDSVSFSVHLDKDLFDGAAEFLQGAEQVQISSKATSLEIRIQGLPVSKQTPSQLAEWKLTLSPLFARVEPILTSHKVRNGKISVKLMKSKVGPWKKGVKY